MSTNPRANVASTEVSAQFTQCNLALCGTNHSKSTHYNVSTHPAQYETKRYIQSRVA